VLADCLTDYSSMFLLRRHSRQRKQERGGLTTVVRL
jgi:hypothetical protein